jgi:beta-lactamase class C
LNPDLDKTASAPDGPGQGPPRKRPRLKWLAAGTLALVLLGVILLPLSLGPGPQAGAPPPPPPPQAPVKLPTSPADWHGAIDYAALDARLAAMTADRTMTGLAVAVVEDGRLAFVRGYGVTSAEDLRPVDARTVFRWASLSKTVSGTLSASLAAEGALSLSDPLEVFHTSLSLPGEAQRSLTVEQLLSQRTGLSKNAYDGRLEDGEDPVAIRNALARLPVVCPPGTCHTYQNIAYDAISEVIAQRTGEPYGETVRRRLFAPLGMKSASVGAAGLVGAQQWAKPHHNGRLLPVSEAYYRLPAAAGVNSSIVDLATWMQAQMGLRPDILPPAVLDAVQRPRVATASPYGRLPIARELKDAGYGLGMRSFTYKGHRLVSHSGGLSGYRSTMMFDPATRTGIVMLWNSDANLPFRFQAEFFDRAYGLPYTDWLDLKDAAEPQGGVTPAA